MVRDIITIPDDRLRAVAYEIHDSEKAKQVCQDLIDTARACGAHGLAATQIGELVRMFVVDFGEPDPKHGSVEGIRVFANPVILESSGSTKTREGCMSMPGTYGTVKRPRKITLQYQEVTPDGGLGPASIFRLTGFVAVVCQHEIDHLDGILFTDKTLDLLFTEEVMKGVKEDA